MMICYPELKYGHSHVEPKDLNVLLPDNKSQAADAVYGPSSYPIYVPVQKWTLHHC
jgi:hypothetical protein